MSPFPTRRTGMEDVIGYLGCAARRSPRSIRANLIRTDVSSRVSYETCGTRTLCGYFRLQIPNSTSLRRLPIFVEGPESRAGHVDPLMRLSSSESELAYLPRLLKELTHAPHNVALVGLCFRLGVERCWLLLPHLWPCHVSARHLRSSDLWPCHVPTSHLRSSYLWPCHVPARHLPSRDLWPRHMRTSHLRPRDLWPCHLLSRHLLSRDLWPRDVRTSHLRPRDLWPCHLRACYLRSGDLCTCHLRGFRQHGNKYCFGRPFPSGCGSTRRDFLTREGVRRRPTVSDRSPRRRLSGCHDQQQTDEIVGWPASLRCVSQARLDLSLSDPHC
jgi:hypothetical protein